MQAQTHHPHRPVKPPLALAIGLAGLAVVVVASIFGGLAVGKSFTLEVASNAKVTNTQGKTKHETITVNSRGFAVYTLSGETTHHLLCTAANGCFQFWLPVTVSSASKVSKSPGIKGKLGVLHRGKMLQVTLGGDPLYTFVEDKHRDDATGQGIHSFGGTWHVVGASGGKGGGTTTTTTKTSTSTSTTYSYPYVPY